MKIKRIVKIVALVLMGSGPFFGAHAGEDYFSYSCKALGHEKWLHPTVEFGLAMILEGFGKTPEITLGACFVVGSFKEAADMAYYNERFDYALGDVFIADMPAAVLGMMTSDLLFPKGSVRVSMGLKSGQVSFSF